MTSGNWPEGAILQTPKLKAYTQRFPRDVQKKIEALILSKTQGI